MKPPPLEVLQPRWGHSHFGGIPTPLLIFFDRQGQARGHLRVDTNEGGQGYLILCRYNTLNTHAFYLPSWVLTTFGHLPLAAALDLTLLLASTRGRPAFWEMLRQVALDPDLTIGHAPSH